MDNLIEYLIIALLLLWSCWVVLRRFMPKTSFKWQHDLAMGAEKKGMTRLSKWLMPKAAQSGCSAGCSGCSTDASCSSPASKTEQAKEQPVQWR